MLPGTWALAGIFCFLHGHPLNSLGGASGELGFPEAGHEEMCPQEGSDGVRGAQPALGGRGDLDERVQYLTHDHFCADSLVMLTSHPLLLRNSSMPPFTSDVCSSQGGGIEG